MTIPPSSGSPSGLQPPGELFNQRRTLPPLSELLKNQPKPQRGPSGQTTQPATAVTQPKQPDKQQIPQTGPSGKAKPVPLFEQPAGKPLADGVWFDQSRRTRDGGVVSVLTLDPAKAELVPVFNPNHTAVSARQIEADKSLLGAINASFFGAGIIGDIKAGAKVSTDDGQPALDKVTDQRHFIAVAADGSVHTGRGGLSENAAAGYKSFIGGFPALYTRAELKNLDQDIHSGAFARRANYGGASQQDSCSRSFIGIGADGRVMLLAAGHGSERGKGVTMADGARLMRELGAVEAYVLDGGGSTTIFARGAAHAKTDGRQVWSYLGVKAR